MYIYVSGPYSNGGKLENVRRAIGVAEHLIELGHIPLVPHLSHYWDQVSPHGYEYWMQQDLGWVIRCDAVFRIYGESAGADREVALARELGLVVYYNLDDVPKLL